MNKIEDRIYDKVLKNLELNELDDLDIIIKKYMKNTINYVLIYCNRDDIPKELELIIIEIVEDLISTSSSLSLSSDSSTSDSTCNNITSIKRGDTTISYDNSEVISSTQSNINFIKDYESQLIYFKKMRLPI